MSQNVDGIHFFLCTCVDHTSMYVGSSNENTEPIEYLPLEMKLHRGAVRMQSIKKIRKK